MRLAFASRTSGCRPHWLAWKGSLPPWNYPGNNLARTIRCQVSIQALRPRSSCTKALCRFVPEPTRRFKAAGPYAIAELPAQWRGHLPAEIRHAIGPSARPRAVKGEFFVARTDNQFDDAERLMSHVAAELRTNASIKSTTARWVQFFNFLARLRIASAMWPDLSQSRSEILATRATEIDSYAQTHGWLTIDPRTVVSGEVSEWSAMAQEALAPATAAKYWDQLKLLFDWAVSDYAHPDLRHERHPMVNFLGRPLASRPRKTTTEPPKVLTRRSQIDAFLDVLGQQHLPPGKAHASGLRNRTIGQVLIETGMRRHGAIRLLDIEVPMASGNEYERIRIQEKGRRQRSVILPRATLAAIDRYRGHYRNALLFPDDPDAKEKVQTRLAKAWDTGSFGANQNALRVTGISEPGPDGDRTLNVESLKTDGKWSKSRRVRLVQLELRDRVGLMTMRPDGLFEPLALWISERLHGISKSTLNGAFQRASSAYWLSGLDQPALGFQITPHTMRHSYAVRALWILLQNQQMPEDQALFTLADLMGHADPVTTWQFYLRRRHEVDDAALRSLATALSETNATRAP